MSIEIMNRIGSMAKELEAMFPGLYPQIHVRWQGSFALAIHGCGDYQATTELARRLGVSERKKQVHNPDQPWFVLSGESEGIQIDLFGSGLPDSCAIVKVTEKIPKQNTVDTGEYIEVERKQIVCGGKDQNEL